MSLKKRLKTGPPVLLDGAMGTELLRRGVDVSLPLWSAAILQTDPDVVYSIHQDYVAAGAEILTTNTFRTTPRTFRKGETEPAVAEEKARTTARQAVDVAKRAAGPGIFVAGSIAPLEDCYSPELYPGSAAAKEEFNQLGRWFSEDGVDLILFETMGTVDEAVSALEGTSDVSCPRWISFVLGDEHRLLSGETLIRAAKMSEELGADALLVNCSNLRISISALSQLVKTVSLPPGLYPNLGRSMPTPEGEVSDLYSHPEFLDQMKHAVDLGARIVGSCCGSRPEHTRLLRELIDSLS